MGVEKQTEGNFSSPSSTSFLLMWLGFLISNKLLFKTCVHIKNK